jgi:hypothetical protein
MTPQLSESWVYSKDLVLDPGPDGIPLHNIKVSAESALHCTAMNCIAEGCWSLRAAQRITAQHTVHTFHSSLFIILGSTSRRLHDSVAR